MMPMSLTSVDMVIDAILARNTEICQKPVTDSSTAV